MNWIEFIRGMGCLAVIAGTWWALIEAVHLLYTIYKGT